MNRSIDRELLAVESLTKSYGGVRALRSADLHVRDGEIHALLGENGAGKSTLVKILAGATTKDSGEIRLGGSFARPAPRGQRNGTLDCRRSAER